MHRLIIVDDEDEIREGLADLIDWPGLGYEVAGMFRDGMDAIRFLREHKADVVLTDIKMAYASGIDLAEFVHKQKLPVKVVILSGYQEFALAREAIRYNVSHYLLKPTDIEEVSDVFRKIREELDQDKLNRELEQRRHHHVKTMRPLMMEQFFAHLLHGSSQDRGADGWKEQLELLGLPLRTADSRCCLLEARWSETSSHAGKKNQDHRQAINVMATKEREQVHYTCVHTDDGHFSLIGNALTDMTEEQLQKKAELYFLHIQSSLSALLGLAVRLENLKLFPSMAVLVGRARKHAAEAPKREEEAAVDDGTPEPERQSDERMIIRQSKRYIKEHFDEDPSMTDVADHVGLNSVYFSRLFKQETGQTFSEYCIDLRIKKAIQYLKDPRYKIYEIGYLVGYKNAKYFHKLFKRQTGLTPSEYRDQL